jgi:enamine deaminase RidA (YjgF/YER057c/UK114 family)
LGSAVSEPDNRPAFKVVVGALLPGHLVRLDVLALAGGRRKRMQGSSGHCIRIGNWVCSSPLTGPDAVELTRTIVDTARGAGATVTNVSMNVREAGSAPHVQQMLDVAFPNGSSRARLQAFVATDRLTADFVAISESPEDGPRGELVEELFIGSDPLPTGVVLGNLVYAPHLTGTDPATHALAGDGTYEQVQATLDNVDRLMHVAGGGSGQIARVNVYMTDVMEKYTTLNPLWEARFQTRTTGRRTRIFPRDCPATNAWALSSLACLARRAGRSTLMAWHTATR